MIRGFIRPFLGCLLAGAYVALAPVYAWGLDVPSIGDPFTTQKKIAPYGAHLKPASCPTPPDPAKPLLLDQVVIATICHNPDSRAAYLSLLASADNYDGTIMSYLPDVTTSATLGTNRTRTDGNKAVITQSSGINAATSVTLYDFGRREASLAIADRTLAIAGLSYDSTLQGFIAQSLQGYFQLLTAQDNLDISKESLSLAKSTLDAAETRYQLGLVPLSDALQARTSYAQEELTVEQANNTLTLARADLAQLMGFAPLTGITAAQVSDSTLMVQPFDKALPALIDKAKEQRVDLKSSKLSLESAEDSLKNAERRWLPSITANASTGFSDIDITNRNNPRTDTIGVNVSIPIFTGFSAIFAERSQRKQLEIQKLQLTQTERNVEKDVLKSYQNFSTSSKSFAISSSSLGVARQLKDVSLGRYREGLGSILDVLNAQIAYRNALQSYLSSRYNLFTTRVDLVRAVGELDLTTVEPQASTELPPLADVVTYQDPVLKAP